MRILVYGAGNIGRVYAGLLSHAGHEVSILARGPRLLQLRKDGIKLEDFVTGRKTTAHPPVVDQLAPHDTYDLVLVALGRDHVEEVLPILAQNPNTPSVMFFGNNAAGPQALVDALGKKRVLLGFPGAAGIPIDGGIRYVITSAQEQPTTIGELDGNLTPRLSAIAEALRGAGFNVAVSRQMEAWLQTHAAEILPTAYALYMTAEDPQRLARTRDALVLMVRAIREGYRILRANRIPLVPRRHHIFRWIPEPILVALMKRIVSSEVTKIKVGHVSAARKEMALLSQDLNRLAQKTSIDTPALQRLARHLDPAVAPLPDGSEELPLKWVLA